MRTSGAHKNDGRNARAHERIFAVLSFVFIPSVP